MDAYLCTLCQTTVDDARSLCCGHSYCAGCISNLFEHNESKCAVCRKEVDGFHKNYFLVDCLKEVKEKRSVISALRRSEAEAISQVEGLRTQMEGLRQAMEGLVIDKRCLSERNAELEKQLKRAVSKIKILAEECEKEATHLEKMIPRRKRRLNNDVEDESEVGNDDESEGENDDDSSSDYTEDIKMKSR